MAVLEILPWGDKGVAGGSRRGAYVVNTAVNATCRNHFYLGSRKTHNQVILSNMYGAIVPARKK